MQCWYQITVVLWLKFRKKAKNASRCLCFNHAMKLSLSRSSAVSSIRNAIGIIKEVVAFFISFAKRNYVLNMVLEAQLMGIGVTRWIERHESLRQFVSELPKIIQALESISHWSESVTAPKAKTLVTALHSAEFVISLQCLHSICALTLPLSRLFQKKTLDLGAADGHVSFGYSSKATGNV